MSDHKLRQQMFHHLETTDDWLGDKGYVVVDSHKRQLVDQIIDYFSVVLSTLIYPAKSYAVAIIYAKLLEEHFGVPFYEALNDSDLFMGTDKFFVPYDRAKEIYDPAIAFMEANGLHTNLPQVAKTIEYFKKEFYLTPNPYFANTDLS